MLQQRWVLFISFKSHISVNLLIFLWITCEIKMFTWLNMEFFCFSFFPPQQRKLTHKKWFKEFKESFNTLYTQLCLEVSCIMKVSYFSIVSHFLFPFVSEREKNVIFFDFQHFKFALRGREMITLSRVRQSSLCIFLYIKMKWRLSRKKNKDTEARE